VFLPLFIWKVFVKISIKAKRKKEKRGSGGNRKPAVANINIMKQSIRKAYT
jgi:hypothetical protein